jgi:hypothetical protein
VRFTREAATLKTTHRYWNPLAAESASRWEEVPGSEGHLWQLTLAEDPVSGDYTRLTRFEDGYDTRAFGPKSHDYPEEVFVVSGRL